MLTPAIRLECPRPLPLRHRARWLTALLAVLPRPIVAALLRASVVVRRQTVLRGFLRLCCRRERRCSGLGRIEHSVSPARGALRRFARCRWRRLCPPCWSASSPRHPSIRHRTSPDAGLLGRQLVEWVFARPARRRGRKPSLGEQQVSDEPKDEDAFS